MENLMKAIDAFNNSKQFEQREYEERIHCINDGICDAASCGQYEVTVYFNDTTDSIVDKIYIALQDAGYWISNISNNEVTISWESVEVKNAEEPAAADENTKPNSILNANNSEDLDDYERECVVKVGHLRDLMDRVVKYDALKSMGVDNWEWYEEAFANACDDWGVEDIDDVTSKYWEYFTRSGFIRV